MKIRNQLLPFLFVLTLVAATAAQANRSLADAGNFVTIKQSDGSDMRVFVAGPPDAHAAVMVVHDYLGISEATKDAVAHLGSLGYHAIAVDLYSGKSAVHHAEAIALMKSLDRKSTDKTLQAGLDYLKRPGRKIATIGFSMGGQESLFASLNDPDAVSATVMIYGSGFDAIDINRLERLKSPVLVVTGSEDTGAVQSAVAFLSNMRAAKRSYAMMIYPGADHGYAQPLFNEGKNFNPEATRATWVLVDDFLNSHLNH